MSAKRGRPHGHVRLLVDAGRFEVAAWLAFTEAGMKPYSAAYLVTFLLTSDSPITTESVEGALLMSSASHTTFALGHADRVRRKATEAIERANQSELAWLTQSSALLVGLLTFFAKGDERGFMFTLDLLNAAGWADTLIRVSSRIESSLSNDFPPFGGSLSRTAARLLRMKRK